VICAVLFVAALVKPSLLLMAPLKVCVMLVSSVPLLVLMVSVGLLVLLDVLRATVPPLQSMAEPVLRSDQFRDVRNHKLPEH
jgi:ABC-type amino acid transport system permease subunit